MASRPGKPGGSQQPSKWNAVRNTAVEERQNREQQEREARWAREQEEKDAKRKADKEKLLREDATRKDAMEKQRLLSLLEQPLVTLLERLNLRDELSLPLAQAGVLSLTNLRNLDQVSLAQTLGLEELAKSTGRTDLGELCALAILSARRDLALQAIEAIPLQEDAELEREVEAKKAAEDAAAEDAAPWSSQFKGAPSTAGASAGGIYGFTEEPEVVKRDGPFRKKLYAVTERWHEYLATKPELGSLLASEDSAVPLWKDTLAWGLWMLSSTTLGKKHASGQRFMGKETIEGYFRCAREYVWLALYPIFKTYSRGEWRLYWKRVLFNFDRFFSDTGRRRWIELAALDARTKAIYARKSPREQDEAEKRGSAMVTSMLRIRSEAKCTPESVERLYNSPRRGQLLLAEASPEYRAYLEGEINPLRRSFSFPERRGSGFNSPLGSLGSASARFGIPNSPGSFGPRGLLPTSLDFSSSPVGARSFTPLTTRSLTMVPYRSRSSYALSPFGPRYTPGAYAQQRPSSLPASPLGLLKWRGRARAGDSNDELADAVAHARRAARKAKEEELIEQRMSAAVGDAERLAIEASKDAARQAAAQHKGKRGSIASAATIAAAIVREQVAARERLQQAEMQRRGKMAEATKPAPALAPQPATVPVAPGPQAAVPMLKDTTKPPSRLPPSQRTAATVKTPRSSRRASSTPRSRSTAATTSTNPTVPVPTSTTAEIVRRPLVPGPTHLADTKVKTPRSGGSANPSSPRSRRKTSATKGKSPSAAMGGSTSDEAPSSIVQHL